MIHWFMPVAVIILVVSTVFAWRDYAYRGRDRRIFTKMRMITILIAILYIIILLADFVVYT
ncbi:MAG: hypothetical protein FWE33_01380 [Defluviitaleaceae bacterium]|nr:hypothetical protein [Defluviitaleaceae bacterium]